MDHLSTILFPLKCIAPIKYIHWSSKLSAYGCYLSKGTWNTKFRILPPVYCQIYYQLQKYYLQIIHLSELCSHLYDPLIVPVKPHISCSFSFILFHHNTYGSFLRRSNISEFHCDSISDCHTTASLFLWIYATQHIKKHLLTHYGTLS